VERYTFAAPGQFLLSSIDVPVESKIVEVSEEVPLLSMLLRLEMSMVREILSRDDLPEPEESSQRRGLPWVWPQPDYSRVVID
jgi:hypothetical protein